ncbi:MAG: lamin tail domain-containing protein, partial [Planctomycetota bacterium]
MLSADLVISEFMASNDTTINDGFGEDSDWIEIHNQGDQSLDLTGYHLTDDHDNLEKWTFPSVTIQPDEYLVIFASGEDTTDPLGYLHTNFRLSAGGEYVALTGPDLLIISEYGENGAEYPPQITDVSYGLGFGTLLDDTTQVEWLIPTDGSLGLDWTSPSFDAAASGFQTGLAAIGYENSPSSSTSYEPYISTEVPSGTTTVYVRHEFEVGDTSQLGTLDLHVQYDDGFIVYLNGQRVLDQNAPSNPVWNSIATSSHNDGDAIQGVTFSLSAHLGLVHNGTNTIAFHALNRPSSSDYLFVPKLVGDESTLVRNFLARPTPGQSNSETIHSGPVINDVIAAPNSPLAGQPVLVTAEVLPVGQSVNRASVELVYRRMFDDEVAVRMFDNGVGPDSVADDGIYSAVIPGSVMNTGEMVRWYVTAEDVEGTDSRAPRFADPTNSAEYYGLVVQDPTTSTDLPTLFWFVEDTNAAETRAGTRASIMLNGQFYDNVAVDLHGQSTAGPEFLKKSFDFDANSGEKFRYEDDTVRVSDFNLLTNYADQTKLRQPLAYEMNRQAGVPTLNAFPISVHR